MEFLYEIDGVYRHEGTLDVVFESTASTCSSRRPGSAVRVPWPHWQGPHRRAKPIGASPRIPA
jgi:hypothetical protein